MKLLTPLLSSPQGFILISTSADVLGLRVFNKAKLEAMSAAWRCKSFKGLKTNLLMEMQPPRRKSPSDRREVQRFSGHYNVSDWGNNLQLFEVWRIRPVQSSHITPWPKSNPFTLISTIKAIFEAWLVDPEMTKLWNSFNLTPKMYVQITWAEFCQFALKSATTSSPAQHHPSPWETQQSAFSKFKTTSTGTWEPLSSSQKRRLFLRDCGNLYLWFFMHLKSFDIEKNNTSGRQTRDETNVNSQIKQILLFFPHPAERWASTGPNHVKRTVVQ